MHEEQVQYFKMSFDIDGAVFSYDIKAETIQEAREKLKTILQKMAGMIDLQK